MTTEGIDVYTEVKGHLIRPSGKPHGEHPYPDHTGRIWSMCPVHPDGAKHGNRSLSLHPEYGLKCFAGCDYGAIKDALLGPLLTRDKPGQRPAPTGALGTPVAVYEYSDSKGVLIAQKGRWATESGKTFRWRRSDSGPWSGLGDMHEADLPLYRLDAIANIKAGTAIYLVEGEKAADRLVREGIQATCLPGGASVQDFGYVFEPLRGHTVLLWPDNDAVGRTMMVRLRSHIQEVARFTAWVTLTRSIPEKGDAYDFFELGGTKAELEGQILTEPVVEHIDRDAIRVTHPANGIPFVFECLRIQKSRTVFDCEFSVVPRGRTDNYVQRLNMLSPSSVTDMRRTLAEIYGKEHDWPKLLASVIALVRSNYVAADRSIDVTDIPITGDDLLMIDPLIPAHAATVLFGDGGSAKSYLALSLCVGMATGRDVCGWQLPAARSLYIDWEDNQSNWARRVNRVATGMGVEVPPHAMHYWNAEGLSLADLADGLRDKILKDDIRFAVIDSAGTAGGGPPEDAETTLAFFRALSSLNVTTLIIAHINKTVGDAPVTKPFGSVMWHNQARRTWGITRQQDDESDVINLILQCHKVNDGKRPRPVAIEVTFDPDQNGPVRLRQTALEEIPLALQKNLPLETQVKMLLVGGKPWTCNEIADELDQKSNRIAYVLRTRPLMFTKAGQRNDTTGRPADAWTTAGAAPAATEPDTYWQRSPF